MMPSTSIIGPGAIKEAGTEVKNLGYKKALVVTDKILNQLGVVAKVTDILSANDIEFSVYDAVEPNPTMKSVHDGLDMLKAEDCDFIISLGGGSPQDAAKAIGILATNGGRIKDYEGAYQSSNKSLPIIAFNTTAGTASEMTIFYVITDEDRHVKMVMCDPNCLATIAVSDPELMTAKPAALTAATGMDALTHAIECYLSKGTYRLTEALALEAIRIISESLKEAVDNGTNIEARSAMAWGSYIAGMAFSNGGLGIVHSMAHQLGAIYNLPHGVSNAVLLPYVEAFNAPAVGEKMRNIAEAMGTDTTGMSTEEAADAAINAIIALNKAVGVPTSITEFGVKEDKLQLMAEQAIADICTGGNPRDVTVEDIIQIYKTAM
jgi:alcohol dehydrogenase